MIPHHRPNGLGCFPAVIYIYIRGDSGAIVVCNMDLSLPLRFGLYLENVMEDVFADEPEIAIHRAGSAALKVPSHKSGILKVVYFGSEFRLV